MSLAPPKTGAEGTRSKNGDTIPLDRSSRNPEIEEVLGAASLLFNGGGLEKTNTIVTRAQQRPRGQRARGQGAHQLHDARSSPSSTTTRARCSRRSRRSTGRGRDQRPEGRHHRGARRPAGSAPVVNGQRGDLVKLPAVAVQAQRRRHRSHPRLQGRHRRQPAGTGADPHQPHQGRRRPGVRHQGAADVSLLRRLRRQHLRQGVRASARTGQARRSSKACASATSPTSRWAWTSGSISSRPSSPATRPRLGSRRPTCAKIIDDRAQDLVDLVTGLVPTRRLGSARSHTEGQTSGTQPAPTATTTPSPGGICSLLGTCRTAVANAPAGDLQRLLVEPVVAP